MQAVHRLGRTFGEQRRHDIDGRLDGLENLPLFLRLRAA